MKKVLNFAFSMILIVALVLTSMIFASASTTHTASDVESLKLAIQNAVDGDKIMVTGDITGVESLTITTDVTFDGNGSIEFEANGFVIQDADVTFNGDIKLSMVADDDSATRLIEVAQASATASTLTINGGEFTGYFRVGTGKSSTNENTVIINGGKFIQKNYQLFDISNGYTTLIVNDGEFVGNGAAMLIRTNDGAATLRVLGGTFTQTGNNPILWIRSNEEFTIGNEDGTGPSMTHDGAGYLMMIGGKIENSACKYNINGGNFNKTGGGSYLFDLNSGVVPAFNINGGTWKTTQDAALIRINDSGIENLKITGGTFVTTGGEPIITKNNGALTVTGGTFSIEKEASTGAVIYLGKDKINGTFIFDGTNVVINNKGKGSVIEHHSACVAKISNLKYEAKGEETAPIIKVDVASSSSVTEGNVVEINGCELTSDNSPIVLAGLPCTLILNHATKITAKAGFGVDNQNKSKVELNDTVFDSYKIATLENAADGSLSMFATLKANETYIFSYNRAFSKGDETILTPYLVAVMANGTTQEIVPEEVVENTGNILNTTVTFKTPEGIADAKNVRLGVKANGVVSGSIENWELFATDKFSMAVGDNLIDPAKVYKNNEVVAYDPSLAEGVLMVEGSFNSTNVILYPVSGADFNVKSTKILMFMGNNGRTYQTVPDPEDPSKTIQIFDTVHPGGAGALHQEMEIEAGKTYRFSVNIKWASTAAGLNPGEKEGIELLYKQNGSYIDVGANKLPEDPTEYKETYIFTAPADISTNTNNFKVVLNFGSAFVSGYATNFSVVEIDPVTQAVIGNELVKNGDFSTGTRAEWTKTGNITFADPCDYVENFFSKVTPHKPGMLFFDESVNYACEALVLNLKPSTTYEIVYQLKTIDYNKDFVPKLEIYRGIYTDDMTDSNLTWLDYKDEGNPNVSYEELENNYHRIVWTTDDILRTHNNRNIDFRFQSHTNSAGYYGEVTVYELDANGNRIGNNLVLNGDYAFGSKWWEPVTGYDRRKTYLEQEEGFLDTKEPATMIYVDGSAKNQNYSTTVTVDASKGYWLSGFYMNMNTAGVKPRVLYQSRKADGAYEVLEAEMKYDSTFYRFEMYFNIPEDAVVKNGKTVLKVQMNNGSAGKAYFAEIRLAEQGKFTNLIESMSGPSVFQEMPYDGSKFIFYYDDSNFDDGDWSGELANTTATTGAVSGMVFGSDNKALEGITMMLTPGNNTSKTDEYGNYSFTNLKPGNYELYLVEKNGNKLLCYDVEVKAGILSSIPLITYMDGSELTVELPEDSDGDGTVEQTPYGALRGYYLDKDGKPISGAKIYLKGLGFVTTNNKGMFEFSKLPVGEYEVYTKLADGSAHVFRKVNIEAYKGALIKLVEPTTDGGFNWLWVVIPAAAVLLLGGAALTTVLIVKKKKTK